MNFKHRILVCTCEDSKRDHIITAQSPAGPCTLCPCKSFTPEPICKCGHGKKAHGKSSTGHCHECGCKHFRAA